MPLARFDLCRVRFLFAFLSQLVMSVLYGIFVCCLLAHSMHVSKMTTTTTSRKTSVQG